LEKTSKIIKSTRQSNTSMPAKPDHLWGGKICSMAEPLWNRSQDTS